MADTAIQTKAVSEMSDIEKKQELERIQLIQRTVAKGTTKDELLMLLYQAKKTGLDPLARQINIIVRSPNDPNKRAVTIQASIDGLRLVAERSGDYAGQDAPEYEVLDNETKATVRVYKFDKKGERYCHSVGVAYMSEYKPAPPNDFMWKKMPHVMIAKVAEALALRKAFPQDLSGIYSEDEMAQADAAPIKKTIDPTIKQLPDQPADEKKEEAPAAPTVAKTEDQRVIDGDTVDETPLPAPAEDPMIEGYRKKIETIETDAGLKMIVGELDGKELSVEQKEILAGIIQDRRQQLADMALGVKK